MSVVLKKTILARLVVVAGLSALMVTTSMTSVTPAYANGPASVADLAAGLLDAVVNISTSQTIDGQDGGELVPVPDMPDGAPFKDLFDEFFKNQGKGGGNKGNNGGTDGAEGGNNSHTVQSLGSGFVIDAAEGIIVTNNHVIADADEITINFTDGKKLKATLVGKDAKTDLAVLKVDASKHKLTAVKFGDSDKARIGDWVMAIGNPFGLGGTVTVGIISARNRNIQSGPYDRFIQTDAAINKGNSGGPLFNMDGDVIGINSAIISPSGGSIGLGFSIPSELASGVVDQLRKYGEARRGWLGVRIQPITDDIAESMGMPNSDGVLIAGVIKGGPVTDGALIAGDVIKSFDGKPVKEPRDLTRMVGDAGVGKVVDLVVLRKGVEQTVKVTLGQLEDGDLTAPKDKPAPEKPVEKPVELKTLGMTLADITPDLRKQMGIADDVKGILITTVEPNSAAAEKRIEAGVVITEVAQEAVTTAQDFVARIAKLKSEGRKNALLMVSTKTGELSFLTLRIE